MHKVIELTDADMPLWDAFVRRHPAGWLCHLSGWKRVLEHGFPHIRGHVLALRDQATHVITAGLPLYTVASPLTGTRIVSIPFATLCDPLTVTGEELHALLSHAAAVHARLNADRAEVRFTVPCGHAVPAGWRSAAPYKHTYLTLERPPETLIKTFHPTAIQQPIARACKSGLTVKHAESEQGVADFYGLFFKTRKRLGLPPMPWAFFALLWDTFGRSSHLKIMTAYLDHTPVASVILFAFGRTMCLEFAADDVRYRRFCPNHLLYWESIRLACAEGFAHFSFGRTDPDNTGLLRFKQRWGSRTVDLPVWRYPDTGRRQARSRKQSRGYALLRRMVSHTPDMLFRWLGDICYRHLG